MTDTDRAWEVRAKLELVRGWLDAHHRQAVLFRCQANFAWITAGGRSHISLGEAAGVASVLVGPDEYAVALDGDKRQVDSLTALAVERVGRRFIPLVMLLKLSMLFPKEVPSRFAFEAQQGRPLPNCDGQRCCMTYANSRSRQRS